MVDKGKFEADPDAGRIACASSCVILRTGPGSPSKGKLPHCDVATRQLFPVTVIANSQITYLSTKRHFVRPDDPAHQHLRKSDEDHERPWRGGAR